MSDEKLRLEAQLRDNMSPGLRKIKDNLSSIRMSPGMQAVSDHMKQLGAETAKFAAVGGKAGEAFGAMGIGGLAAAGSFAGVVAQMRELGKRTIDLKELARETSVSANWLNAWSHAGLHFGVSADAMRSALNTLSAQMPQFEKKQSKLYGIMAAKWPTLTEKLLGEDSEHQINDIIKFLGQLKNQPQLQKQLASEFFGNGDDIEKLFKNGADGFWAEFKKQQKLLNPINPELTRQAQAFKDATIEFNNALENFENKVGPAFLGTMKDIVNLASSIPEAVTKSNEQLNNEYNAELDKRKKQLAPLLDKVPKQPSGDGILAPGDKGYDKAPYIDEKGVLHKSSWTGNSNRLFHKSAFITRSDLLPRDSGLEGIIAGGTKSGVIAAFREMIAMQDAVSTAFAGSPLLKASYNPDNPVHVLGRRLRQRDEAIRRFSGTDLLGSGVIDHSAHSAAGHSRIASWLNFLQRPISDGGLGMPRNKADAAVAMMQGESGANLNPRAFNPNDAGTGPSGGTAQWHAERFEQLKAFADKIRKQWTDMGVQQRFFRQEMLTTHHKAFEDMMRAPTAEGALEAGIWGFERPRDPVAEARRRLSYLNRLQREDSAATARGARPVDGHIRADIHVHGNPHNATVKGSGVDVTLHRWPVMSESI